MIMRRRERKLRDENRLFKARARLLLRQLRPGSPDMLADWNIRAQTLLMFEWCRRLVKDKEQ